MIGATARSVMGVARDVLSEFDLDEVLARTVGSARQLTGARYAALGVLDDRGAELARFLTLGIDDELKQRIGPLPTGHGVLGEVIRNPRPLRLADIGEHPHSYGFPLMHPQMRSFLGVPVFVAGAVYGNLYLADKEGAEEFTEADEEAVVALAGFAGLAIDHARRHASSESRRADLQRTVDALDATVTIARTLAGETELDTILDLVAKRGRDLVSARALVIELEVDEEVEVAAGAGELPANLVGQRVGGAGSVAGRALRALRPQRLEGLVSQARFKESGLARLGLDAEAGLAVPLALRGRVFGALVAVDRLQDGPRFSIRDAALLESFAVSAATALAAARSLDAERRHERLAASDAERGRWARELHDETLQGLAALRLDLAAIQDAEDLGSVGELSGRAAADLEEEIAKLHSLISELRPLALDELGIGPAVEALVQRARAQGHDVQLRFELGPAEGARYDPEVETAAYRIVQEALGNAVRHAGASQIEIDVSADEATLAIAVRDDGTGFDSARRAGGFGLAGMRERVELLDGSIEVRSEPGEGTGVRASLPCRRRDLGEVHSLRSRARRSG